MGRVGVLADRNLALRVLADRDLLKRPGFEG
jgi:hypothetical protein